MNKETIDYLISRVEHHDDHEAETLLAANGIHREGEPGSKWQPGTVVRATYDGSLIIVVRADNQWSFRPWIIGYSEDSADLVGTRISQDEFEDFENPVSLTVSFGNSTITVNPSYLNSTYYYPFTAPSH